MAPDQSALLDVLALRAADVKDRICSAAQTIHQALMEAGLDWVIGAERDEPSLQVCNQGGGHWSRVLTTRARGLGVGEPKASGRVVLREPLKRCSRVDQALFAVNGEAYLHGLSACKVDDRCPRTRR